MGCFRGKDEEVTGQDFVRASRHAAPPGSGQAKDEDGLLGTQRTLAPVTFRAGEEADIGRQDLVEQRSTDRGPDDSAREDDDALARETVPLLGSGCGA
jgi:hypothetical protein